MNESDFHTLADRWLSTLFDALEAVDSSLSIEVEYQNGILSIVLEDKTWLVNKHAPTQQLWLASPVSGGLHFSYDGKGWSLADGRTLGSILEQELHVKL